jgi:hypothetical protein
LLARKVNGERHCGVWTVPTFADLWDVNCPPDNAGKLTYWMNSCPSGYDRVKVVPITHITGNCASGYSFTTSISVELPSCARLGTNATPTPASE